MTQPMMADGVPRELLFEGKRATWHDQIMGWGRYCANSHDRFQHVSEENDSQLTTHDVGKPRGSPLIRQGVWECRRWVSPGMYIREGDGGTGNVRG
jgi:hypothetical protein